MELVPVKEKAEGLTGNHRLRGIYEQENFIMVHGLQIQSTKDKQSRFLTLA